MTTMVNAPARAGSAWDRVAVAGSGRVERGDLTDRELEILDLAADGLTNREIGARLTVSQWTVKAHLAQIATLTGAASRAGSVAWAYHTGRFAPRPAARVVLKPALLRVLVLIADDRSDREIADALGLSVFKVQRQARELRRALQARTRTHTVRRGVDAGALSLAPRPDAAASPSGVSR